MLDKPEGDGQAAAALPLAPQPPELRPGADFVNKIFEWAVYSFVTGSGTVTLLSVWGLSGLVIYAGAASVIGISYLTVYVTARKLLYAKSVGRDDIGFGLAWVAVAVGLFIWLSPPPPAAVATTPAASTPPPTSSTTVINNNNTNNVNVYQPPSTVVVVAAPTAAYEPPATDVPLPPPSAPPAVPQPSPGGGGRVPTPTYDPMNPHWNTPCKNETGPWPHTLSVASHRFGSRRLDEREPPSQDFDKIVAGPS